MDSGRLVASLRLVGPRAIVRAAVPIVVAAALLVLVVANLRVRASWLEAEDGVLWASSSEGVVARELSATEPGRAPASPPTTCWSRSTAAASTPPTTSTRRSTPPARATSLTYTVLRHGVTAGPDPPHPAPGAVGYGTLYMVQALGRHLHAAGRRAVRLRRPGDQATLHFFWLSVAFFGVFALLVQRPARSRSTGSSTGATSSRCCCCRRCSCTSRWCSRSGRDAWVRTPIGRAAAAAALPAGGAARRRSGPRVLLRPRAAAPTSFVDASLELLDRAASCCTSRSVCSAASRSWCARSRRVRSVTARRQLRWIVWGTALGALPFALGYALPFALGLRRRAAAASFTRHPARPHAARLRLGHRPLPPDGRRGHHQARAGLRRGGRGDRRDLRACCCGWPASVLRRRRAADATRSSRCSRRWSSCCSRRRSRTRSRRRSTAPTTAIATTTAARWSASRAI